VSHQLARTSPQRAKPRNTLGSITNGCNPTDYWRHTFLYVLQDKTWTLDTK